MVVLAFWSSSSSLFSSVHVKVQTKKKRTRFRGRFKIEVLEPIFQLGYKYIRPWSRSNFVSVQFISCILYVILRQKRKWFISCTLSAILGQKQAQLFISCTLYVTLRKTKTVTSWDRKTIIHFTYTICYLGTEKQWLIHDILGQKNNDLLHVHTISYLRTEKQWLTFHDTTRSRTKMTASVQENKSKHTRG